MEMLYMAERIKLFRDDVQNKIASAIRTQKRKYGEIACNRL